MSQGFSRALAGRRSVAVACALATSVLLAACGGSGRSANSAASAESSREAKFVQLAKCLREHGINASTTTGTGGRTDLKVQGGVGNITPQTFEAAQKACRKYAPAENENLTPQQRVEREEAVQKFAKCMREHGIKVEAHTNGGAIAIGVHGGPGSNNPNPESPAFQAAQKACQAYLPFKGPRGGPGGPTTNRSGGPGGGGSKFGLAIGG